MALYCLGGLPIIYQIRGSRNHIGYRNIDVNIAFPNYREISHIFLNKNLSNQRFLDNSNTIGDKIRSIFIKSGLIKYFNHSYLVRSNSDFGSLLETVLDFSNENTEDVINIRNQSHKGIVLVETGEFIYKIPTSSYSSIRTKKEFLTVEKLSNDGDMKRFVPKIECMSIGAMNIQIVLKEKNGKKNISLLKEELDAFFNVRKRSITEKAWDSIYSFDHIKLFLEYNGQTVLFDNFKRFLSDIELRCTFSHGDLNSRNLILTNAGLKVINWEHYSDLSPVEIDCLNLILYEETFLKHQTYYDVVKKFLTGELTLSRNNRFRKYKQTLTSLDPRLAIIYCLQHQEFQIGRYENPSYIPYLQDRTIKMILELASQKCNVTCCT
jgi:hypothetical protein